MNRHVTMNSFTEQWWLCMITVVTVILVIIQLPTYFNWAKSKYYRWTIAFIMISNLLIENAYGYEIGQWRFQDNLPLHLCGISGMMGIILMFRFNANIAQIFFYWALTGGVHSLLTPEFDLGVDGYFFYAYFISHGSLLLVCFYIFKHHDFIPTKRSWIKSFWALQILALTIGIFNWLSGSNYMYLSAPPIVDNPLIVGKWPWYILIFEALAIIHFWGFYKISEAYHHRKIRKISATS